MWTCPTCDKRFARKNQWHSCANIDLQRHFNEKDPKLRKIFDALVSRIREFGDIRMNPVKSSVQFLASTTFLSVKVLRDSLNLEFYLKEKQERFPIYKTLQLSSKKIVHFIRISSNKEIDRQLVFWLKESYNLNSRPVKGTH